MNTEEYLKEFAHDVYDLQCRLGKAGEKKRRRAMVAGVIICFGCVVLGIVFAYIIKAALLG